MGWYTLERRKDLGQLQFAVSELYSGVTVLESYRHVYTPEEKLRHGLDHDGVSYHAAMINGTGKVRALIMLERGSDKTVDYKPYTEHDCPGMATCPRSILEKLTPTKNEWAIQWRNNVSEFNKGLEESLINNSPKNQTTMEQNVSKTAEEIKELFSNYEKMVFTIGKEDNIKKQGNWLSTGGYVYHSETKETVIIPSININDAGLISKFEKALADGNKKFTAAIKLGDIKESQGEGGKTFSNIPVFVNDIEKYEKTVDIVGSITKVEEFEKATKYVLLLPKVEGKEDSFQEVTITKSNEDVAKGVDLKKGATIAVRGSLVTSFTNKGNLKTTVFPKVIKPTLKELEAHKAAAKENVKKKNSMKVS